MSYPMSLTRLVCQVSELVNSDACPRPTTKHIKRSQIYQPERKQGAAREPAQGEAAARRLVDLSWDVGTRHY